jgi:alginate O-acetyltransferase complex protein AlgI
MFFNDLAFVWLFVPATLFVFFLAAPRRCRRHVLIAASLLFYFLAGGAHIILLLGEIVWVHAITRSKSFPTSRPRLLLAIAIPLGALVLFKYSAFLLQDVLGLPRPVLEGTLFASLVLPVGISFFTFELISYAIDRYRKEIPPAKLSELTLFVTFFPHLVAGPILRYRDVAQQFEHLPTFRLSSTETRSALLQICTGYVLKVLLADGLASHIGSLKGDLDTLSAAGALFLVFGFSIQIYFDFFGYSLIAIGLGRLVGIPLPENFNRPYEALNPREFWRRWHMSLSFWLRDYLYLPLGGNRRYVRNILIVFVICGIWHGAGWNFALWGLLHALLVIGYHVGSKAWDQLAPIAQRALTFTLVSLLWLPFLFDVSSIAHVLASLTVWSGQTPDAPAWLLLGLSAAVCFFVDHDRLESWLSLNSTRQIVGGVGVGTLFVLCLLYFDRATSFIYFRF